MLGLEQRGARVRTEVLGLEQRDARVETERCQG